MWSFATKIANNKTWERDCGLLGRDGYGWECLILSNGGGVFAETQISGIGFEMSIPTKNYYGLPKKQPTVV